jgi:beta-alanine--pyruvate transaminase
VDTALKITLAYHGITGAPGRRRLVGRARGYHGAGFAGISVGGISPNRTNFCGLLPEIDHLGHTHNLEHNAFSRGQPEWGGHLAEELNDLVALHGPGTIAALIVEPMAGSTGVLVPPKGYLETLRGICDAHGILLIFDEVITSFGRLGASFAAKRFGVTPDVITLAKGLTNAAVPMGAVLVSGQIFYAFMNGPENIIELFHGYTYSSHPLACAAGLATLALYERDNLFERAASLESYWQNAVHGLQGLPNIRDIRDIGLTAGIELTPREGAPGARGYEALVGCFEAGALVRVTGEIVALSPPLIIDEAQIDELFSIVAVVIENIH